MLSNKAFIPNIGVPSKYNVTKRRRFTQSFFLILYFIFPLFGIFYFDSSSSSFVLLGKTIGINNSVLFVLGFIVLLTSVITAAITTGRSFCGWVCPQNFLSEVINKIIKAFALKSNGEKKIIPYAVITAATLLISISVAINFMFYFGAPANVFNSLIHGQLNGNITIFASIFGILVFSGIGIFRHDFCKYACPYGIMQAAVADKTTLRVRFAKERSSDCIDCDACTDICYVDIEPRKLIQADPGCMNCGLCVEACHQVLEPLGVQSMLDFTSEKDVKKENINSKAVLITTSTLFAFLTVFIYMFFNIPSIDLTVTRDDSYVSVLKPDGYLSSNYFVQVMNQTTKEKNISFKVEGIPENFITFDKSNLILSNGQRDRFKFKLNAKKSLLTPGIIQFNVLTYDTNDINKKPLNIAKASLYVPN
ncbi:MAG: 4Fe-4S binding protein [Candidatus Sericytochromatia bacterium]|nr:4Fe-4S binding protein [Candidatus Sericytochromatia bacterium]